METERSNMGATSGRKEGGGEQSSSFSPGNSCTDKAEWVVEKIHSLFL